MVDSQLVSEDGNRIVPTEYAGLTSYPEPDAFKDGASEKLTEKRVQFFKTVASQFSEGAVYYPGSGPDPVPYKVFGDRVVYGSLTEAEYFTMLKDPNAEKPRAYESIIQRTVNLDALKAVYADVLRSPFPDKAFKIIVLNALPIQFDKDLISEFTRLLDDEGIIIFEDNRDLKGITENASNLERAGYKSHTLDKRGGVSNVRYFGYTNTQKKYYDVDRHRMMQEIGKDEFLQNLQMGDPVIMMGHIFRVFQKPTITGHLTQGI